MDLPATTFWSDSPTNIGLTIPDVWFYSDAWNMKFSYVHCTTRRGDGIQGEMGPTGATGEFNSKQVTE
jgi:hypothetical protein